MPKYLIIIMLALMAILSSNAFAWTPSGEKVTVDLIYEWENNSVIIFKTSLGHYCYIPPDEKNMYSLVLSLMATGKQASIHCHDSEMDYGGILAHRVHRVIGYRE